ncbi:VOC family protein [Nocardia sp. CNY236]|uniref:VOC family protein n=1 Tax=Nocardia sp. CNY236 TaxID=1169152 RepID=UPI0004009D90|nr:VOC family protein [Nocardia sp. CNY236]
MNTTDPLHRIGIAVPDPARALRFFDDLVGTASLDHTAATVRFEPGIEVSLYTSTSEDPPSIIDIGTNHLCFRVADIDAAVTYLHQLPDLDVLGDVITVPDGPIRGNRWIYFRAPWGTLFELQQWPETPGYFAGTSERLFHGHHAPGDAALPTLLGLDHSGYSVSDLEAAVSYLARAHRGRLVLRTEIAADRAFMRAQFGAEAEGTSVMAMVAAGGLNLELFQHRAGPQRPARPLNRLGGNYLALDDRAETSQESGNALARTDFGIYVSAAAVR